MLFPEFQGRSKDIWRIWKKQKWERNEDRNIMNTKNYRKTNRQMKC